MLAVTDGTKIRIEKNNLLLNCSNVQHYFHNSLKAKYLTRNCNCSNPVFNHSDYYQGNRQQLSLIIVCVYSNSHNDVPRVAQQYGTIAAHTRRRASVLVVFVLFCAHMHSFAGLISRTPPPTFSDTAITDR